MNDLASLLSEWQTAHPHPRYGFFLGSGAPIASDHVVYYSAGEPSNIWIINNEQDLIRFEKRLSKVQSRSGSALPRFVGYFSFDAGRLFDSALAHLPVQPNSLKTPYGIWAEYPEVVKVDLNHGPALRKTSFRYGPGHGKKKPIVKKNELARGHFSNMVAQAKRHISAGDIYQANLSLRFSYPLKKTPLQLYQDLSELNPSPYACLLKFPTSWIISSSPELLCEVRGRQVWTRPIAGTRPRGATVFQDRRKKGQLLLSPKERAEHIMLVDLERNDLGRVCSPGSVRVTETCGVERYSHVMHIVSQVEGRLRNGESALSAFKALFPGGTITGCPKIKSIEIIEQLERQARGPFYGSAGFFDGQGNAVFNILIRTAFIQNKTIFIQAGAGIVADSHPAREHREILAKAQALLEVSS